MFSVGDVVFYSTQGVCFIKSVELRKNISGQKKYYILSPVFNEHSTVMVPVDNDMLTSRMHPVIEKKEVNKIISLLKSESDLWIQDDTCRREEYKKIILSGNREKIAGVISALSKESENRRMCGKRLTQSDEYIFEQAKNLLYDEIAYVLEIDRREIGNYINNFFLDKSGV